MSRSFQDTAASRERTPLLIGLVGASGGGKTFSALRLATGIQRVSGGDIGFIDTEARRSLHYADQFKFRHLEFKAPFGPLDYLEAIEHFGKKGTKIIIIDSMSHEHEGPGGVLETHTAEQERLSKLWNCSMEKATMAAWKKPKEDRRKLINSILQMPINFIFCFRAKEKVKLDRGGKPIPLGWMPIAGEEFVYEMSVNILLNPSSGGVPCWSPEESGEKAMIKLPGQFKGVFSKSEPLSESIGEQLARWAAGSQAPAGSLKTDAHTAASLPAEEASPVDPYQPEPPANISAAQRKRLFAMLKEYGWDEAQFKAALLKQFGIDSTKLITTAIYDQVCGMVEGGTSSEPIANGLTESQMSNLHALIAQPGHGWTPMRFNAALKEKFGWDDMKKIPPGPPYDAVCRMVAGTFAAAMGHVENTSSSGRPSDIPQETWDAMAPDVKRIYQQA